MRDHHASDRAAFDALARAALPEQPWRTRPVGVGDVRRHLGTLSDSDVVEVDRVKAALTLSRARGYDDEIVDLLVRALNEPLAWLPRVAVEILRDWPKPFGLRVDGNGLLRRCPHPWALTEVVTELGGSGVERHCPDCDARVVLPQCAGVLADRCEAARTFVADLEQRDAVIVREPHRHGHLWRGDALALGEGIGGGYGYATAAAVELVNAGRGVVYVRRRRLPGENEIELFGDGAQIVVAGHVYRREGLDIVVEMLPP